MATSKGQASALGHSPSGSFGSGGTHQKGGVYGTTSGDRNFLLNSNMHVEVESTAGTV